MFLLLILNFAKRQKNYPLHIWDKVEECDVSRELQGGEMHSTGGIEPLRR